MFVDNPKEESQDVTCDDCKTLIGNTEDLTDNYGVLDCIELRMPDRTIHHFCEEKCLQAFTRRWFKGFKD